MLRRLVTLSVLILLAGFLTSFMMRQQGMTVLEWDVWRLEIRTSLLITAGVVLIITVVMLDRMISFIAGLPFRVSHGLRQRRSDAGQEALALGLVAASVGDRREAIRQEKKARKLIGDGTLTKLLSAQVAALEGKTDVASQYFTQLAENRNTAYFGEAGLMRLGLESGDDKAALVAGRAAFARKKNEPSLARGLFALEARQGNWPEAITALAVARQDTTDEMSRQQADMAMAVLHYLQARDQESTGDTKAALKTLEQGLGFVAGLVPAALMAAEIHDDQKRSRKASGVLEKAFLDCPHPDLAKALMDTAHDRPKLLTRLMQLADRSNNKPDALYIVATIALELELWGEARRLMEMIATDDRDAAGWALMAQIARHAPDTDDTSDWPDAETCLARAASASRGPAWQCSRCGVTTATWQETCPSCDSFASLNWRRPASAKG